MESKLSDEQSLLIDILQEECSEVIGILSKCKRFGLLSTNPLTDYENIIHLMQEIGDLECMLESIKKTLKLDKVYIEKYKAKKLEKIKYYHPELEKIL